MCVYLVSSQKREKRKTFNIWFKRPLSFHDVILQSALRNCSFPICGFWSAVLNLQVSTANCPLSFYIRDLSVCGFLYPWGKGCVCVCVCACALESVLLSYLGSTVFTAAKSLQSRPTLCDPTDGSPPGSPVPGILQARILEWVAISFSNAWKWEVKVKLLSCARVLATPWIAAYQAPPSMGFSRQEYWSGLPLPSPTVFTRKQNKKTHAHVNKINPQPH